MRQIILLLIALCSQIADAKKLSVFLYCSEIEGDRIYKTYTKNLGFERKLSNNNMKNIDYHVTIGSIYNLSNRDAKELQNIIKNKLEFKINNIIFHFGIASLFGRNIPYIVMLPKNVETFKELNNQISEIIKSYKDGKYDLNDFTKKEFYIPHLSLNAKLFEGIKIENLYNILFKVNRTMSNSKMLLDKLIIKIE